MYDIKQVLTGKACFKEIEYLKEERRKSLILRSCKITLSDWSVMYIKEIWKDDQLYKYSFYWLSANNKLIMG